MLTANDIRNATFSRGTRGYKTNEVDDYLEKVIIAMEELQQENTELLHKLEVLADRIQEYRNEEDSIRSALLTAQKSADKILKEATDEKERILADARQQADDAVRLSQEKSVTIANETREKVTMVLHEAKEKSSKLLLEAKTQSENMLSSAVEDCQEEKRYLEFLKEQEIAFRQQLVEMYKKQFEMLKKGPDIIKALDKNLSLQKEPISLQKEESIKPSEEVATPVLEEPVIVLDDLGPAVDDVQSEAAVTPQEEEPVVVPVSLQEIVVSEDDVEEPTDSEFPIHATIGLNREEDDSAINQGFTIKQKFSDLKFGDDYDISADDDYDDYGV